MKAKTEPLKEQEKFPEGTKNETDLSTLPDPEFKKELIKILKELRKAIDRNALSQKLETYKEKPIKIRQFNCLDENQAKGKKQKTK